MTDPATVAAILARLADLDPACRAWATPAECCCWTGIQQAIDAIREMGE